MTLQRMEREQRDVIVARMVAEARAAGRRAGDITAAVDAEFKAWKVAIEGAAVADEAARLDAIAARRRLAEIAAVNLEIGEPADKEEV